MLVRYLTPRSWLRRSLRALALSLATLSLITCGQDSPLGLGTKAGVRLITSFPSYARVAPLAIDHVGIIVSRFIPPESSEIVYGDTVNFSVNRQTLRLDNIQVEMDEPTMDAQVTIQLLAGSTLLYQGSDDVTLVRGRTTDGQIDEYFYSGLGDNLTSLVLSPRDTVVSRGAEFDFGLDAFDVQGAEVPQYYVGWALSSGAAASADINAVGHLTASTVNDTFFVVVTAANGVQDSARVIVSNSTTAPSATLTWTGGASTDFSAAGNWSPAQVPSFNDSLVIGATASQRQPTLTVPSVVVGAVNIINGGSLTIGGLAIVISRGLSTSGSGVLNMTFPEDIVSVLGDAVFDGGNELDRMTDGGLSIGGNLTQRATNSGDSFHPSGNHTTVLVGATPTLSFATPGLVPGSSHFQRLAWIGTGTLTLATQVMAHDEFVVSGTGAAIIASSNSSRLTVGTVASVAQLAFNNVPLTLQQTTANSLDLSNATFQNMPTNVSQLVVSHPGGQFSFDNLTFSTTPVAPNGFYIDVTDINSQTDGFLTIDMATPTPTSGGAFVKVSGGAVVNWPSGSPVTTRIWSGATSTNWNTATNWVGGVVPGATDSAVIVAATNAPLLGSSAMAGAVNVASGTLTIGDAGLNVARGFATTGTGALAMQSGAGLDVGGSVFFGGASTAGLLDNGTIAVGGNFTQTSGTSPQSFAAGTGNRVILNNPLATVTFTSPSATNSRFGVLQQGGTSTGFTFASDVVVTGTLEGPDGFSGEIFGSGVSLTLANGTGCCVDLNGVVLILDDPTGQAGGISGVTFTNIPTTAAQLTIRHPGLGTSGFILSSMNFQTLTTGASGSYVDVTDINGATGGNLVVFVAGNDPGNGAAFSKTGGGAQVFWPTSTITWTGATSNDWFTPANWNALRIPFDAPVLIPAGTPNAPVISNIAIANAGNLTVATGQTLTIQTAANLNARGNVTANGSIVTTGTGLINLAGTTGTIAGNVGNLDVEGAYTLAGRVTVPNTGSVTVSSGGLTFAGHTLATGSIVTNTTSSLLVMTNTLDSLIVNGATNIGGADETGRLTAGVMLLAGDLIVSPFTPLGLVGSGTHKVVFNGTGVHQLSFPATAGSRLQNLELNMIAGGVIRASGGPIVVAGDVVVSQGQLDLNSRRVDVGGNFSTVATGTLAMRTALDSLMVSGNATFAGNPTDGLLFNGVLRVVGDFTQSAVSSQTSFAPSGLHKTVLGGAAAADVSMGSPGPALTGSHFAVLDVSPATGGIILDVNMEADSLISTVAGARIESPLVVLTARRVQVTGLTFFNTRFTLDEQGGFAPETFSNVTFNGYPANSTSLTLFTMIGPGSAAAARPAPVTTNVNFLTLPGNQNNFYVDLTSSNNFQVNLTMTGSNQGATAGGNGAALTKLTPLTGVATVAWP